jgi:hypothetical protein
MEARFDHNSVCVDGDWLKPTVEVFDAASLGVHSAFHAGPKPLETGAAG